MRFALTTFSIVIGVAFVSGSSVLTDTLSKTFDNLFKDILSDVDVSVRKATDEAFDDMMMQMPDPFSDEALAVVQGVEGVAQAEGAVQGMGTYVTPEGEQIVFEMAPALVMAWHEIPELAVFEILEGVSPTENGQVVIDSGTAEDYDLEIGETLGVAAKLALEDFEIVGIAESPGQGAMMGAKFAFLSRQEAQRMLEVDGQFHQISVVKTDDVTREELRDRIQADLGSEYEVLTGDQATEEMTEQLGQGLGYFKSFLLVFALIALFVGTFLIVNTFSIVVAQRSRELALLRAIGASRRQVRLSVVAESALVGLLAGFLGLFGGIVVAGLLRGLIGIIGIDLPSGSNVIALRTVILSFVVGIGVTVVSAVMPALKASRVSPIAALRGEGFTARHSSGRRVVTGVFIILFGLVLLFLGLFADTFNPLVFIGFGAAGLFVGISVLGPFVVRPVITAISRPAMSRAGVPGTLGVENAQRNPRRTASTAAALMIGLGLSLFVLVFGDSFKASASKAIDETFAGDFMLQRGSDTGGPPLPFSPHLAEEVQKVEGVYAAVGLRGQPNMAGIGGPWVYEEEHSKAVVGVSFADVEKGINFKVLEGEVSEDNPGLLVHDAEAEEFGWLLGDTVKMQFPTAERELQIKAIYEDSRALAGAKYVMTSEIFDEVFPNGQDMFAFVILDDGVDIEVVRERIEQAAESYPGIRVQDQNEIKEDQRDQIDQLLGLILVLLVLAVFISALGIVNTLALSIFERTREIGLLRAVGMTGFQLRRMITWESVLVSLLGAMLGALSGIFLAWAVMQALAEEGFSEFSIPVVSTVIFFVLSAVLGVLAAVFPARRAAKVDVLSAVTVE